jgi:hypothetical protein
MSIAKKQSLSNETVTTYVVTTLIGDNGSGDKALKMFNPAVNRRKYLENA